MTETPARKPRKRRTFSAFGDVRKMPSDYEIVTHQQNWTLRKSRQAPFEQNPSSPANLWFLTYRDRSPLQAQDWDRFRDPDALTYRSYVTLQSAAESTLQGALQAHADSQTDASLSDASVALLPIDGHIFEQCDRPANHEDRETDQLARSPRHHHKIVGRRDHCAERLAALPFACDDRVLVQMEQRLEIPAARRGQFGEVETRRAHTHGSG